MTEDENTTDQTNGSWQYKQFP